MSERSTELVFREVSCQKPVNGSNFAQGSQDFNFTVGGVTSWIPSRSYFVCNFTLQAIRYNPADSTVTAPYGASLPATVDQLAFADFAPSCLYNNVYFRAGGQDISTIVNYVPQAHALRERTSKSGAWLNTVGKSAYMMNADLQQRIAQVSIDDLNNGEAQERFVDINAVQDIPATVVITSTAASGVLTAVLTGALDVFASVNGAVPLLQAGDYLSAGGVKYLIRSVTNATTLVLDANLFATGPLVTTQTYTGHVAGVMYPWANNNVFGIRMMRRDGGQRSTVFALFQPPIGIFQWAQPMCAGDYRFSLNPNSNYQRAIIESPRINGTTPAAGVPVVGTGNSGLVPGVDYNIIVNDIKLYIATVKMSIPAEIYPMQLYETMIQSKTMTAANGLFEFTVPSSTIDLAFWVQSSVAGFQTLIPPTRFACKDGSQNNLQSLQITYANVTKPSTKWESLYTPGPLFPALTAALVASPPGNANQFQQRYNDDLCETRLIESPGGAESLGEWLQRGPYYYYTFARDRDDRSTQVQIAVNYSSMEASANLFLAAIYSRVSEITTASGQVQSVKGLDR